MEHTDEESFRKAAEAATSGDVADRIHEATVGEVWRQLREQVDPGVLFQVDEAFGFPGTQDDPIRAIADATFDAVQEATVAAHDRAALIDRVTRAVLTDPRVREAIANVTKIASEVAESETQRLQPR